MDNSTNQNDVLTSATPFVPQQQTGTTTPMSPSSLNVDGMKTPWNANSTVGVNYGGQAVSQTPSMMGQGNVSSSYDYSVLQNQGVMGSVQTPTPNIPSPQPVPRTEPQKVPVQQPYPTQPMYQQQQPVGNNMSNVQNASPTPVSPTPQQAMPSKPISASGSFTEMPFAGVNQQEEESAKIHVLPNQPVNAPTSPQVSEVSSNSNMQPVEKKTDENAGLKFLAIIAIILIVVILCLPLVGLN